MFDNQPITQEEIERLRSRIGIDLRIVQHHTIASQDNITWFCNSFGDDNPLWLDANHTANSRYGCLLAPPAFFFSVVIPSGNLAGGLPGVHSFLGGNDWHFYKPIRLNTKIRATAKLIDVSEKKSSYSGRSVIQSVEVIYRDEYDELLAIAKGWSIRVEREAARNSNKYASIPNPVYTQEQIKNIEDIAVKRAPRGRKLLYWDDLKVGDEVWPLAKGPLAREDMEVYLAATGNALSTYYKVKYFRRHPAFFYFDTGTNSMEPVSMVNLYDHAAQEVGIPRAYDVGSQRICWLEHMLTNWIGDDGFLQSINVRLILPNLFGDTQWCRGKIVRLYEHQDQPLVEINVWCENQRGEHTAEGLATVRLLSRKVNKNSQTGEVAHSLLS